MKGEYSSLCRGRNYPSLAKRGEGRFSEAYVFFIPDSHPFHPVLVYFVTGHALTLSPPSLNPYPPHRRIKSFADFPS
jgi:hypothetical protein